MTTTTIAAYPTASAAAARREPVIASMLGALRASCESMMAGKLDARGQFLSQASDHDDLARRERAWRAYEHSLATFARIA